MLETQLQTNPTESVSLGAGTVLVVDDDPLNRLILTRLLASQGFEVETAGDGRQALDTVSRRLFDVILLDIIMPEIDGFEVLKLLKSNPALQRVPVIMISGLDEVDGIVRCIEMGAEDYLQKPFNHMLLKARINACLERKHLHDALAESLAETVRQRDNIEFKNTQMLDSIRYAERIQHAMLPQRNVMDELLRDYFVVYKPKDIVSGDFYWFYVRKQGESTQVFVAVADCTGHGVPGAFMSMIGITLLNQIIGEKGIDDPATVLEQLHAGVRTVLKQDDGKTFDGMDMCLCRIDGHLVTFAGAKRPLLVLKKGEDGGHTIEEIKGDRKTVGGLQKSEHRRFGNCVMEIGAGTVLYLTSDGFEDQGNGRLERYGKKRLKQVLLDSADCSLPEQKQVLLDSMAAFQGGEFQRDDITLLAVRVPLAVATTAPMRAGSFTMTWDINL